MMMNRKYKLEGSTPLLMHNNTALDPFQEITRELKSYTGKRKKTDEDLSRIAELEWHAGLYYDKEIGPYIQGQAIDAALKEAAKRSKRGKDVDRGMMCIENMLKLEYTGPRTREALFRDNRFVDVRAVKVGRSGIMRCRPIFHEWAVKVTIAFTADIFNEAEVDQIFVDAGRFVSLGDFRPRFGKFNVTAV